MAASIKDLQDTLELVEKYKLCQKYRAFEFFEPYAKQTEFYNLGTTIPERCLSAGNQFGKSISAAYETAMHATGLYTEKWGGARFKGKTIGWVCGVSGNDIVKGPQKLLLGRNLDGTGMIPKDSIIETVKALGVPDLLDHVKIRNVNGDVSYIYFKSYEKGREKFQAETIDWAWCDA